VDAKSHNLVLARELLLADGRASEHAAKLSQIFELLWEPVCRYLILSSVSRAVAEDLAQEAFLRLYASMEKGQSVDNVSAWVFRVARNLAVDHFRKKDPLNSASAESMEFIASGLPDPAPDAEQMVLQGENRQRFEETLRTLSHQEQQCVFLRLEGLRYAEIADVLGISVGNVSTYLSRGIKKLRKRA
jgi:RNA polymerase sigma-70 factor (ECF subfamily)